MPASIRWAWAVNAASSVLGSAAAMFLAIYLGLRITLMIGSLFYFGALLSVWLSPLAGIPESLPVSRRDLEPAV
jgi:hypothetical protein